MSDSKNMLLAIVLSVAILMGWHFFYEKPRLEAEQARIEAQEQAQIEAGIDPSAPSAANNNSNDLGITPEWGGTASPLANRDDLLQSSPRVAFDNGRIRGSVNLQGGYVDDLILQDYFVELNSTEEIILFHPSSGQKPYYAHHGWTGSGDLPNRETLWSLAKGSAQLLNVANPITLFWENKQGVRFEKIFSLDENYLFQVDLRVVNNSNEVLDIAPYGSVLRTDKPEVVDFYILHEGLIGVINDSLDEVDYEDVDSDSAGRKSTGGWLGITDKYWLAAVIPDQSSEVKMGFQSKQKVINGAGETAPVFQSYFVRDIERLQQGGEHNYRSYLYAGAKETFLLDDYEDQYGIGNFDLAVDFGWFYFLTKPIYQAIHYLNGVLGNFGLAILALTVFVKMLLLPLAYKSYASMSKMKLLQPKVMEIREQYGDDKDGIRTAMMQLYKDNKVNPMSGCLPILLQIPVFFSLYKVLFVTIEMRHAPFYGWIHDLSAPDPLGILTGFGLVSWEVPALLAIVNIGLWPIIMGITMWLQQKLNPTPPDPIQAKIFALMPFMFTFLLGSFPAGLVIYWAWNNTLSIAQQWSIMRIVASRQEALVEPEIVASEEAHEENKTQEDVSKKITKVKNKKKKRKKR